MEGARQPHGVKIEVGHDNRKLGLQLFSRDQVGNNPGGHEMGADGDVRIEGADKSDQRFGVEPVDHVPHGIRSPGFITGLVPPSEKVGC